MNLGYGAGATAALSEWASGTKFRDLRPEAVHATKRLICDTIGCAVGARSLDSASIVIELASRYCGAPDATLLGSHVKVNAAAAAFANGYLGNVLDADETLEGRSHHAACTVFAALAVGESAEVSGAELITAIALGYDVGARIGHSMNLGSATALVHGWLVFASAAAAAKILQLDAERFSNALGIAGWVSPLPAALRWQELAAPRPMLKVAPHGFMSQQGVLAAQLAHEGFLGDQTILEGENGYWKLAGATKCDWDILAENQGERWWVEEVQFKGYAFCGAGSQTIDLFRRLIREHNLRPEEVQKVSVWAIQAALYQLTQPKSQTDVPFSLPFALAAVAYGFELGPLSQSWRVIQDPRLHEFTDRIEVFPNTSLSATEGEMPSVRALSELPSRGLGGLPYRIPTKVEIRARGQIYEASSDFAWGDPKTNETAMTDDELKNKFRTFCAGALRSKRIEDVLDVVFHLEDVDNIRLDLMSLLS